LNVQIVLITVSSARVTSRDITRVILNEEQRRTKSAMPSKTKQQRWQNLLRLQDLSVGMFVEVNSGDPKNPWFGEIFQLYARKKKKKGDRRDERDDPYFEPVGVKWIARVQGAKEKLYEYKGGSHRIWLESIVKCGHDLDCGVYLKRGGKGAAKEAAAKKPTTTTTPVASPKKSSGNNKNALALVVRETTPTKKKTTTRKDDNKKNGIKAKEAEKRKHDVEKRKLARERERLKKEKSRLMTANREVQRKLNLVEKDLVRVAAGKMPLKKKKKPVAPLVVRTKSAPVSKKNQSPKKTGAGGAVRRVLSHVTRRIRASTPPTTKTTKNTKASSSPSTKQQKNNDNKTTLTVARKTTPTLQPPAALFGNLSSSSDSEEF